MRPDTSSIVASPSSDDASRWECDAVWWEGALLSTLLDALRAATPPQPRASAAADIRDFYVPLATASLWRFGSIAVRQPPAVAPDRQQISQQLDGCKRTQARATAGRPPSRRRGP